MLVHDDSRSRDAAMSGSAPISDRPSFLLIDDDSDLCSLMVEYFTNYHFRVECAHDGREGLRRALIGGHDLVVLDVMLPILDGFEVLRQLRRASTIPVIMLTARTAKPDRIVGLEEGADQYLLKPFAPEELLAHLRALLRRTRKPQLDELQVGELRLHISARRASLGATPLELTVAEFDILHLLMRSPGHVLSRDEIVAALYNREATCWERAVDVHISHLRKKLESGGTELIRTVRGVGYVFALPVSGLTP